MKNMIGAPLSFGIIFLIILLVLFVVAVILFCVFIPVKTWFRVICEKVHISPFKLGVLKSKKMPYDMIADWFVYAKKSGVFVTIDDLEIHYNAGGNLQNVINGLICAKDAGILLSLDSAKTLDNAGTSVSDFVKSCVNPIEIDVPEFNVFTVDNMELKIKMSLTLLGNQQKIVGGTLEETLVNRAKENCILAVNGFNSYKDIMKNCDLISKNILAKKIDSDSRFILKSVQILNIEIVKDIDYERSVKENEQLAQIAIMKAEEDKLKEEKKVQETKKKIEEEKLKKVEKDVEMTKSIIKAFEDGKFDMMDYCKLQNMIADTNMRNSIIDSIKVENNEKRKK